MDLIKKQKISERNKKYYAKHKTDLLEKKKKHYTEHKDEYAIRMKKYYLEHKDELSEKHKKYYFEHKFHLSQKHEKLIDITVSIPSLEELEAYGGYERTPTDHRGSTEENLICALEIVSKGTRYEDICKELIEKAKTIFMYCENLN